MSTTEIAEATGGTVEGPPVVVDGATQDSRTLSAGQLFVPIVDARDGHEFIGAAVDRGAAAYLTSRRERHERVAATAIKVADTRVALTDLGRHARSRVPGQVIAITGSVGKTSTKDLLAAVMAETHVTGASDKSFNNELGVPLTLVGLDDDVEVAVIEMGARSPGNIAHLCSVARPTIGVVTTVGAAHVGEFGSIAAVAATKGELPEALPADGYAVLNAEVESVAAMAARTDATVVTFGNGGDVRAESVSLDEELRPSFRLVSPWGIAPMTLAVGGAHNVANALAASAAAFASGSPIDSVVAGLERASLSPWRMALARTPNGALVLDDSYNANPISVAAALRALAELPARRRVAVLGTMAELGADSAAHHREIGDLARSLDIEVIAVDAADYGGRDVADLDAALYALGHVVEGDAVLVKGSRVAGLERLAARLLG